MASADGTIQLLSSFASAFLGHWSDSRPHAEPLTVLVRVPAPREFAPMRGEFMDVGGTRLYYFAAGTRGGGDPVVFLHGFPGSSHGWRELTPLMPDGRRLVVVDLMGCGRSDGPGGTFARNGTIDEHAGLIRRLMDDLNIPRAAIVGHSLGGVIAQSIAVHHPDRISALALLSTPTFDAWPRTLARLARTVRPLAGILGAPVLASFVHGSAIRGYTDRDSGRRSLDQTLVAYPSRLGTPTLLAHLSALRDPGIAALGARLGTIRVPTAVIWGADDPFLPASLGERITAAIPNATLGVIPGARHFVAEDAPEQCATIIGHLLNR